MKTRETESITFPDDAELAALRAWYAGVNTRVAVARYLGDRKAPGASARSVLARIRRTLTAYAASRHRDDLAEVFGKRSAVSAKTHARAIETLRNLPAPTPLITDAVDRWLQPRIVEALHAHDIRTLADLTVRIPRRRRWWTAIAGLGTASAHHIETFFAAHPTLTERAHALVATSPVGSIVPWEQLRVPHEVDGSRGQFRAPQHVCLLNASNDYEAIQSWLSLHESAATQRAYRKEAERLILWAIVERGVALSSLTTDDAIAYRSFLRRPAPRERWIGPSRPPHSIEWRPFNGALSPRSTAYALTVLSSLFRWLVEQRYVLANPFAGVKVRGTIKSGLDTTRGFTEGEWLLIRTMADGLEWSYGWTVPAAQRLRFLLDFGYATELRASEFVDATLGDIRTDEHSDHWLHVVGKGGKLGKVTLPRLARTALDQYLMQRGLPVTPERWNSATPIVASLEENDASIETTRLGRVLRRFFVLVADAMIQAERPAMAEKLRRASPHWIRHTHASHALARGAELIVVRDNLRHASISTTSTYLHGDEVKRARQFDQAFNGREHL
ncbi:phage integrase family protein [Burkholderia gladioli]|uniref:phage integrase family protein n=1 Tax=Burkholderia gladioli TaxID=28095 RepID=UPI002FE3BB4D